MIDTGSWVTDYSSTFCHWLLVGRRRHRHGAADLLCAQACLGVKAEAATGIALIMPWVLGFLIFTLFPFVTSFYLSFTDYNILRPISPGQAAPAGRPEELYKRLHRRPQFLAQPAADLAQRSYQHSARPGRVAGHRHAAGPRRQRRGHLAHDLLPAGCAACGGHSATVALDVQPVQWPDQHFAQPVPEPFRAGEAGLVYRRQPGAAVVHNHGHVGRLRHHHGHPAGGPERIPRDLYEAATIDGAGAFGAVPQRHRADGHAHPVLRADHLDDRRDAVFHCRAVHPDPRSAGTFLNVYIWQQAFRSQKMGYASALAWILLAITLVLTRWSFARRRCGSITKARSARRSRRSCRQPGFWGACAHRAASGAQGEPYKEGTKWLPLSRLMPAGRAPGDAAQIRRCAQAKDAADILTYLLLGLGAALVLVPFAWMIGTSLTAQRPALHLPARVIPNPMVWKNYIDAWNALPVSFTRFTANTLFITLLAMTAEIFTCSVVAYGFARFRFPGRKSSS